ncbi:hypothetical protein RHMOL_Rhmol04G0021500 [Rhododendron molle]|uniref:Uncharacterized protein n=1 Tax=Rhododendron molle TaxID=49168 RepID=A0ACC0NW84_RHOML|nr:hypothetical protein RHMOL_Rhmol04G0021500 [Rhododendron molle]
MASFYAVIWTIWLCRNDSVFNKKVRELGWLFGSKVYRWHQKSEDLIQFLFPW